ncbi:MAG: hypothetical protein RLZZ455_5 [Candidatus Parcubacteria bacterium]|jgi:uncharacterized membrane protein
MLKLKNPSITTLSPHQPDYLIKKLHSFEGRLADYITFFSGSMYFVYFHVIWFSFWILANQGLFAPTVPKFDPYPYGLLTMIVSLEAIFLSTFIMISQNRQALVETYREFEEEQEQREEDIEQEELEEEVEDIQKDLDDIKNAMLFIQQKLTSLEKSPRVHPTQIASKKSSE